MLLTIYRSKSMQKELTFSLEYWRDRANFFEGHIELVHKQKVELRDFIVERIEKENEELKKVLIKLTEALATQLQRPSNVPPPINDYTMSYMKTVKARRIRVDSLELSVRVANGLKNEGLETLGDVCKYTEIQLYRIPNFGRKSMVELKEILHFHGLSLNYKSEQ
jgi:DNA-directed RNA polymerase alpha subunit